MSFKNYILTKNNPDVDAETYLSELFATGKFRYITG